MAFIGTAVIQQVSDSIVRITGLTLSNDEGENNSGTIGLVGNTGTAPDVTMPASFNPLNYTYAGVHVPLQACVSAEVIPVDWDESAPVPMFVIAKTGTNVGDFRITIFPTGLTEATVSPSMEIYVRFHN
jgi:hypothetical protein